MAYFEREIKQISGALEKDERIVAAYLLGSSLTDHVRPDSDIDIALLPAPGCSLTQMDRLLLKSLLEEYCPRRVDIGILNMNNLVYIKEVVLKGRLLFCENKAYHDLFVATALSLYSDLRSARKEVEDAYTA